jgi:hypothetical protein
MPQRSAWHMHMQVHDDTSHMLMLIVLRPLSICTFRITYPDADSALASADSYTLHDSESSDDHDKNTVTDPEK